LKKSAVPILWRGNSTGGEVRRRRLGRGFCYKRIPQCEERRLSKGEGFPSLLDEFYFSLEKEEKFAEQQRKEPSHYPLVGRERSLGGEGESLLLDEGGFLGVAVLS